MSLHQQEKQEKGVNNFLKEGWKGTILKKIIIYTTKKNVDK